LVDFDENTIEITQGNNSSSFNRYSNDHQRIESSRAAPPSMMQHMYNGFVSVASAVSNLSRSTARDTSQTNSGRRIQNDKDCLLQVLEDDDSRISSDIVSSSSSSNPSRVTKAMDQEEGSEGEAEFDFGNGRVTDKAPGVGLTGTHTHFGGDSVSRTESVIVIDSDDEGGTTHEGSLPASATRQPSVSNINNGTEKYEVFNDEETQLAEPGPGSNFKEDSISFPQIVDTRDDNSNDNNSSNNSSNDAYNGQRSEETSRAGCGTVEVINGNMMKAPADRRHSQRGDDSSGDEVEVIKTVTRKPTVMMCSLQPSSSSHSIGYYPEPDESRDGSRRNASTSSATKRNISESSIEDEDEDVQYKQQMPPKKRKSGSQYSKEFDDFIVNSDIEDEEYEESEYSDSDKPKKKEKAAKKSRSSSGKKTGQQKKARAASPDSSVRVMSSTVGGTVDLTDTDL
jgi:hypothetical protein